MQFLKHHTISKGGNMFKRISILLLILVAAIAMYASDFIMIVNKANNTGEISSADLQNIYSGKKSSWPDGKGINATFNKQAGVSDDFLKDGIKKTLPQYQTFWKKAVFTGTGTPPKELDSDAAVKSYVAANQNAIGFISAGALDGSVKKLNIK